MQKIRPLLLISLSVAVGLTAMVIAARMISLRTEVATKPVVVASQNLLFGTQLHQDMLEVMEWPANNTLKDPVSEPSKIYDRVINTPILRGEPILESKLAPMGEKGGLSTLLHDGSRAVTVKVNEIVGVAGFVLTGNYVDVMVNATDRSGKVLSKIVLNRILVLALAQDVSMNETKPRLVNAVTLEVSPKQAEQLDLARSIGTLSLVLRSQNDQSITGTSGASLSDIFTNDAPVPSAQAVAPVAKFPALSTSPKKVEVLRGSVKTME